MKGGRSSHWLARLFNSPASKRLGSLDATAVDDTCSQIEGTNGWPMAGRREKPHLKREQTVTKSSQPRRVVADGRSRGPASARPERPIFTGPDQVLFLGRAGGKSALQVERAVIGFLARGDRNRPFHAERDANGAVPRHSCVNREGIRRDPIRSLSTANAARSTHLLYSAYRTHRIT